MSRNTRKKLMIAALNDDEYGTDAIIAGTPVAMQTSGLEITPIEGDDLERELDDGKQGNTPVMLVGTHVKFTAGIEISGSGDAVTPVAYASVLESGGYRASVLADSVEYLRVKDGSEKDITTNGYFDGAEHIVPGVRSTFTTSIKVGEIPKFNFECTGLYGGIAKANVPTATFADFVKPVKVGEVHTTFKLGGTEYAMLEFECAENNEIQYDENTLGEQIYLTDWKSEGTFVIEAPGLDVFDPFTIALAETQLPLEVTHGTVAGNIYRFVAGAIQLGRPTYADRNGRMTYSIPYRVIGEHKHVTK